MTTAATPRGYPDGFCRTRQASTCAAATDEPFRL